MPDRYCKACYGCEEAFTMYRRRHHCRMCGQVFCNTCSNFYVDGMLFNNQSNVRSCKLCYNQLMKQLEKDSRVIPRKAMDTNDVISPPKPTVPAEPLVTQNASNRFDSYTNKNIQNRAFMHLTSIVHRLVSSSIGIFETEESANFWKETIVTLVREVVSSVDPDVRGGDSLDIRPYVKIKIIPGGSRNETMYFDGVLFRKNVSHKKMASGGTKESPRILLLSGGIEFQRTDTKLSSMDTLIEQEDKYMEILVEKIMSLRPDIILVGKAVARKAQELLCEHNVLVMQNMKPQLLERIARMTNAMLLPSTDHMIKQFGQESLGTCQSFWLQVVQDDPERMHAEHRSRILRTRILRGSTYAYIQGCPAERGCSIRLRGESRAVLKEVKRIIQFSIVVAYHLRLEVAYYSDRQADLPAERDQEEYDDCSDSDDGIYDVYDVSGAVSDDESDSSDDEVDDDEEEDETEREGMATEGDKSIVGSFSEFWNGSKFHKKKNATDKCDPLPEIIGKRSERQLLSTSLDIDIRLPFTKELRGIQLYNGLERLKRIAAKKTSVEDHQTLLITTILMSEGSGPFPTQKNTAEVKGIKFYTKQDIALGQFITENCLQLNKFPRDPRILEQTLCFVHRPGRVDVTVHKITNDIALQSSAGGAGLSGNADDVASRDSIRYLPIRLSSYCKECRRVVIAPVGISEETWKISFGKFLEIYFYNRSARCKVAGCNHPLRDSHKLSFQCDGYMATFEFFPLHPYALHIRNHMSFPVEFHHRHTMMILKALPQKHSTLIEDFRLAIFVLEKEIREILAGRPEDLALATADVKMMEAELNTHSVSFLEEILKIYDALPASVRDFEYESQLKANLRELLSHSSNYIPVTRVSVGKEDFFVRDSFQRFSDSHEMAFNSTSGGSMSMNEGGEDLSDEGAVRFHPRAALHDRERPKSLLPSSSSSLDDPSSKFHDSLASLPRAIGMSTTISSSLIGRFPMYILRETYLKAAKWNSRIDVIYRFLEWVRHLLLHQQQQQLQQLQQQQLQQNIATASLAQSCEDTIAVSNVSTAATTTTTTIKADVEVDQELSNSSKLSSDAENSSHNVEIGRVVVDLNDNNNIGGEGEGESDPADRDAPQSLESSIHRPREEIHHSESIASDRRSATDPADPPTIPNAQAVSISSKATTTTTTAALEEGVPIAEPLLSLFNPTTLTSYMNLGMSTMDSVPHSASLPPPPPPVQYQSLSQALEYNRRATAEKPMDKMSRITKALKGFLVGGVHKDTPADEQNKFFVPLGEGIFFSDFKRIFLN